MKKRNFLFAASAALLLQGCALQNQTKPEMDADTVAPKASAVDPLNSLKALTIEARDELRLIAKAEQAIAQRSMTADQHRQKSFQSLHVPEGFEKRATFNFFGHADKAAEMVAEAAGYEFKTYGRKPLIDIFVSLNQDDQPLNDALREIGIQTGTSATLEVYEQTKMMVLNYASFE